MEEDQMRLERFSDDDLSHNSDGSESPCVPRHEGIESTSRYIDSAPFGGRDDSGFVEFDSLDASIENDGRSVEPPNDIPTATQPPDADLHEEENEFWNGILATTATTQSLDAGFYEEENKQPSTATTGASTAISRNCDEEQLSAGATLPDDIQGAQSFSHAIAPANEQQSITVCDDYEDPLHNVLSYSTAATFELEGLGPELATLQLAVVGQTDFQFYEVTEQQSIEIRDDYSLINNVFSHTSATLEATELGPCLPTLELDVVEQTDVTEQQSVESRDDVPLMNNVLSNASAALEATELDPGVLTSLELNVAGQADSQFHVATEQQVITVSDDGDTLLNNVLSHASATLEAAELSSGLSEPVNFMLSFSSDLPHDLLDPGPPMLELDMTGQTDFQFRGVTEQQSIEVRDDDAQPNNVLSYASAAFSVDDVGVTGLL